MKNKRIISSTLILTIASTSVPIMAQNRENVISRNNSTYSNVLETNKNEKRNILTGDLELDIKFNLPIKNTSIEKTALGITLRNENESATISLGGKESNLKSKLILGGKEYEYIVKKLNKERGFVTLEDTEVAYYNVTINNLPSDKYNVEVFGEGFNKLEAKGIEIKDYSKRLVIEDTKNLLIGDFNKDNIVNGEDYEKVLENIETEDEEKIKKYDLNRDSEVDILDLHYVHNNMEVNKENPKIENTNAIIDPSKVKVENSKEDQTIEGSIEDILEDEGSVSLGLKDSNKIISKENPVELKMQFEESNILTEKIVIKAPKNGNAPTSGIVKVVDENGKTHTVNYDKKLRANVGDDIVINLGKQIAVKEVTIVVTGTVTEANLAEIAKVEFLNNVYEEVPAPSMNIPKINLVETDHQKITVGWGHEANVTSYSVRLRKKDGETIKEEKVRETTDNKVVFEKLDNFENYYVSVQSVNGEWKSGYSEEKVVTPMPKERPAKPEGVSITDEYRSLKINWKKNEKAEKYSLFYREKGTEKYEEIKDITGTSYTLTNLKDETEYEVYLTAHNRIGTSPNSEVYTGKTISITIPEIPKYKQINTSNGFGVPTKHIVDVEYPGGYSESDYPDGFNKFNIVDDDFTTHWTIRDWDTALYSKRGPIVTFDKEFKIDTIMLATRLDGTPFSFYQYNVKYWDKDGKENLVSGGHYTRKSNDKNYYILKLDKPIEASKIQVNLSGYGGSIVSISELKFYNYDSLEDDTRDLFKDDLLIDLKEDVTLERINELKERVNTKDSVSDEYHPFKNVIEDELKLAEDIFTDKNISNEIITVNQNITTANNGHLGFNMANDYQSLGVVAKEGEELTVYVGTTGNVLPKLVFTQFYPESGSWKSKEFNLRKGKNIITVPKITNMDVEKGGSVYVRYPNGTPSGHDIKVRVSGGEKIPTISVANKINNEQSEAEIKESLRQYIRELKQHVEELPNKYEKETFLNKIDIFNLFTDKEKFYDEKTSILNSTEIETDKVTLSFPASKVLEGIIDGADTEDEQVNRLYKSLKAWEQIMDIAYAEKGLYKSPDRNGDGKVDDNEKKHKLPGSRMNIRYTRMFDGAFMYASAGHVGIEMNSVPPLMKGTPYVKGEDGKVTIENNLFGWGIAHEIGHVIDQNKLTYVETTNNILALLVQTFDDESKSRLELSGKYEDAYKKVTSGTVGLPSDVFTKLVMFWQLHLAYDNEPNYKMLDEDNNNSFYANLYRKYREADEEMNSLSTEDRLIRIASDVVQKDLSDFFYSWGLRPSKETLQYVGKYEKENRKIQFLNDEARRQKLNGITNMSKDTKSVGEFKDYKDGDYVKNTKRININLNTTKDSDKVLGYEIYRNGVPVAFTTENTFEDIINAENNRTFKYEVVAYDYLLNKTEKSLIGTIKVSHDGSLGKDAFTIDTNTKSSKDLNNSEDTTGPIMNPAKNDLIDNDLSTVYEGEVTGTEDPYVIVEMNKINQITGLKYKTGDSNLLKDYEIYVSKDKENWTLAKSGTANSENLEETIYFNKENTEGGKQLWTYEASYVKFVAKGSKKISLAEIDIIGQPGDNIDIGVNGVNGVGKLSHDFEYADGKVIKEGSIIVTGEYRGNPAFNVALLRNDRNEIVSGKQILLAEIPSDGHLGEISSGTFIYFIEPENIDKVDLTNKVKMELYRVNDALTNEGQRLVSDSLYVYVPENLPSISLQGENNNIKALVER